MKMLRNRLHLRKYIRIALFVQLITVAYLSGISSQNTSWDQRPTLQMGIEGSLLFESQLLQNFSSSILDEANSIRLEAITQTGLRYGAFIRWRYYNNQNIESGIYRISRQYSATAIDPVSGSELADSEVSSVAYEIPLVWTIAIRTSRSTYLYAGMGGMASFLASDFGSFTGDIQLSGGADPRFIAGMVAIAGYEWDWGKTGGLYVGGQFQHSFGRVGRLSMRYRSGTTTLANGVLDLNGAYLAVVVRYMLPGS